MRLGNHMKTRIHVNQHNIRANAKGGDKPVITVKDYKTNRKANQAEIVTDDGVTVAKVVYSPDKPLACGAKVWVETDFKVITEEWGTRVPCEDYDDN